MSTIAATPSLEKRGLNLLARIGFWLMLLIVVIYTMGPFVYAISISFRTNAQVLVDARYIPNDPTLLNYQNLLGDNAFLRTMFNSAIVATVTVIACLVVGSFAAYALGRVQFKGRMVVMYLVLAMTMFPQISILSGLFSIVNDLKIYGSTAALMFTYPIFTLPFTVWVLTSFFQGLPAEIEQAALVDGASPFQTFWRILVPLTAPAMVTTGLLAFISAWNEYLF
ncbi:carbohydrate ABC transporter permease, partial [bacterium]